jgi:flagellar basal-body rod modification protein FlgD
MEGPGSISGLGGSVLSSKGGSFGDNPFLQLLVTEMRTQTPLEPVDNASFMQQMASFSSMNEQRELNANMLRLLDYQGVLARLQGLSEGSALLGKTVTWQTEAGESREGTVESVFVDDDGEVLVRVDGEDVPMRRISAVSQGK